MVSASRGCRKDTLLSVLKRDPLKYSVDFAEWKTENMHYMIGPSGGTTTDGLCGAPIVDDDTGDGVAAGFPQLANNEICLSPVLDEIIDRGWDLQKVPQGK